MPFQLGTGPRTAAQVLEAADTIETQVGEIANGMRKAGRIDMESMAALVQFARDCKDEQPKKRVAKG